MFRIKLESVIVVATEFIWRFTLEFRERLTVPKNDVIDQLPH